MLAILLVTTIANKLVLSVQGDLRVISHNYLLKILVLELHDGCMLGIVGVGKHWYLHLARLVLDRVTLPVTAVLRLAPTAR